MKLTFISSGFRIDYQNHCLIHNVEVNYADSTMLIKTNANEIYRIKHKIGDEVLGAYQAQYGLTVSSDGRYIFVQSWENGLYCYEISKERCIWQHSIPKVTKVIALEKAVVCLSKGKAVFRLNMIDGQLIERYNCGDANIYVLGEDLALLGPFRTQWMILHLEDNSIVRKYKASDFNPNNYHSFLVVNAAIQEGKLVITGSEQSAADSLQGKDMVRYTRELAI